MKQIVQISAGTGPAECRVFVPLLYKIMAGEGVPIYPLTEEKPQMGSMLALVEGDGVAAFRERWEGTVKWIWKSTLRPHWPRKNWFVSVAFFPPPSEQAFSLSEVRVDTFRASGHGGQHVNRTDSAGPRIPDPRRRAGHILRKEGSRSVGTGSSWAPLRSFCSRWSSSSLF